ncbi:MAG: sulfite exporter TauE/SafE family protein [Myxococcales bacterium]|nr:sulfite exporter TauE/SafE family protein [Myxococcales bacterium]
MALLVAIGLLGGILTTVTGVGGGMVALALLSLLMPPATALALSAAALTVGNAHRAALYARAVDRAIVARFGVGLAVGALAGAVVVTSLPPAVLHGALIVVAALALARALGGLAWAPSPRALTGSGAVVGAVGASAGGAGVLVSPVLLAAGVRGDGYVATVAASALILNSARVAGYALGGLYSAAMVPALATLAAALVVGNLIGRRVRAHVRGPWLDRLEVAAPLVAIVVTLASA